MKDTKAYCEPFCLDKNHSFEIHKVQYGHDDVYSCFTHFHEVHELIIFENISGFYFYSAGKSTLENNDLVFTPSFETHNFECAAGSKSWYILQFLPSLAEQLNISSVLSRFGQGMHLRLSAQHIKTVQQQAQWLHECYRRDANSELSKALLKTLILWIAEHAHPMNPEADKQVLVSTEHDKLKPIMEKFKHKASVELSLTQAAALCFISPSYFSKLFKRTYRYSYSEYTLRHKLYSAARLLSQSDKSITEISYELNFASPSHLIFQFKRQFALTPRQYRTQDHAQ
ncbi:helix-turn-helix transcriptional regulator [Glaciecola siphonariae]|uniref:Helix-turn-helix transcriptional regulator n=1 Tax=Glaciecola siphonariae TaxID=521012 RepID=A0ABV9LUN3_9ALTE